MKAGRLILINLIIVVVLLIGAGIVYYFSYQANHYVSTDNASVFAQQVTVSSPAIGTVESVAVTPAAATKKGDILMTLKLQNGHTMDVKAPMSGHVLATFAGRGDEVAPGTPLVALGQLSTADIHVNVLETSAHHVHPGQTVDITLPADPGTTYRGTVKSIGPATASSTSALFSASTSSTFEKQTQWIPVTVTFDGSIHGRVFPGMSASVRIHI